jgi:hypothetical protein
MPETDDPAPAWLSLSDREREAQWGEAHATGTPPEALRAWLALPPGERQALWAAHRATARPGLLAMAGNLARAVVGHVADGGRLAEPEVVSTREAICRACPRFEPTAPACLECGCGTVVKGGLELKLSWASSSCPLDPPRWGPA